MTEEKEDKLSSENGDTENPEMPEEWMSKPIDEWVEDGLRPSIKDVRGIEYLVMRKGKKDRGLGRYSKEKFDLLLRLFPKLATKENTEVTGTSFPLGSAVPSEEDPTIAAPSKPKPGANYLSVELKRPAIFPKQYMPTLKIIRFYEVFREYGGKVEFSEFINELVEMHLRKCNGFLIDRLPITGGIDIGQS